MELPDVQDLDPADLPAYREQIRLATEGWNSLRANARALERELGEIRGSATSADGYVQATVDLHGRLLDLTLDERIYRTPDSIRLAQTITRTLQAATADACARTTALTDRLAPGTGLDALLRGDLPAL